MNNSDLATILKLVETKFGRGSSLEWRNRDFEDLNFEITKATKTNISAHTLKRIFGKIKTNEYYLPQKATIIALKQYVDFEKIILQKHENQDPDLINTIEPQQKDKSKKNKTILIFAAIAFLIIGSISTYILHTKTTDSTTSGIIKLISTEGRIPKSVQFEYTTPNNTDSFGICYDGNYSPILVKNGKKLKSNYYYQYPGLFRVRMWKMNGNNDIIISPTILAYVQTKGWEVYGFYNNQKQLERFYHMNLAKCMHNNIFGPTKQDIHNVGIDTSKLPEITLNNYHLTGVNGDNFKLETSLKNPDEWPGSTCNSAYLYIVGRKKSIELHFANPGCSYWIHCRLSEKKMDKRNENLKNFTFDMSKWQHFDIENKNKHIKISVNNIERFSSSYTESIGEIVGITVRFQGNGYLENLHLSAKDGKTIFRFPEQ